MLERGSDVSIDNRGRGKRGVDKKISVLKEWLSTETGEYQYIMTFFPVNHW